MTEREYGQKEAGVTHRSDACKPAGGERRINAAAAAGAERIAAPSVPAHDALGIKAHAALGVSPEAAAPDAANGANGAAGTEAYGSGSGAGEVSADNGARPDKWGWMRAELDGLRAQSQYRTLVDSVPLAHGWIERHGKRMLNLASNHYLGLPHMLDEAQLAAALGDEAWRVAVGSTASRLIVGNDPVFAEFEREFAEFKGTESCLLYSSGYMANVGIISALMGRRDVVFSDRLNHASIVDGIVLSRAEHKRYRHRDLDHLERLLRDAEPGARKLIVTDTVFSMDGSLAPLQELVRLKERYGALLMVDEAHSGGVFGERGEGLTHALGLTGDVDIQMGTFSKAYGCYGAYVAGDRVLTDYLVNHSRSLIYTTALPPMVVRAVRHNWRLACGAAGARRELAAHAAAFRSALQALGFDTGASECHIVPLLVGGNEMTLRFSERLQERGIAAVAIRPPTVPEGTARIRFTLTAAHRPEDLQQAVWTIGETGRELGLIG